MQTHTLLLEHFLRSPFVVNIYPVACVPQPLPLCGALYVLVVAMYHMSEPVHIFWESPRSRTMAVSILKGGTLRALGRVLTSEAATLDPRVPSLPRSLHPNFRLVLPVQHMTLSLCCLTKHWPNLPTHSHAGWTNEIKAVHKRKVALSVKTGKSCSRRDTVCQQCYSFYHKEIWQRSNCDGWRGWGRSCENKRQTFSDKVSVALSFFGLWPLP